MSGGGWELRTGLGGGWPCYFVRGKPESNTGPRGEVFCRRAARCDRWATPGFFVTKIAGVNRPFIRGGPRETARADVRGLVMGKSGALGRRKAGTEEATFSRKDHPFSDQPDPLKFSSKLDCLLDQSFQQGLGRDQIRRPGKHGSILTLEVIDNLTSDSITQPGTLILPVPAGDPATGRAHRCRG